MATQLPLALMQTKAVTFCLRCRHRLTDPVSIAQGYGPVCWQIVQRAEQGEPESQWRMLSRPHLYRLRASSSAYSHPHPESSGHPPD